MTTTTAHNAKADLLDARSFIEQAITILQDIEDGDERPQDEEDLHDLLETICANLDSARYTILDAKYGNAE